MEKLEAIVENIVYRNDENGYTVAEVSAAGELHTAVGTAPQLVEGAKVLMEGEWVSHAVYGLQFKIGSVSLQAPDTLEGISRYLASGIVSGVGPVTAQRIVDMFGLESLEIIRYQPGRLTEVGGISAKKAQAIAEGFAEHYEMQAAMVFLQSLGISTGYATKIYKQYGAATEQTVRANPYQLVDDIEGIGFKTADRIAQSMGIDAQSLARMKAGLIHILKESAAQEGHTCLPQKLLFQWAGKLLDEESEEKLEEALARLAIDTRVVMEQAEGELMVWLPVFRYAERDVAKRVFELTRGQEELFWADLGAVVDGEAERKGIELASEQREAVVAALEGGVSVITGGPGTGKTTCINCVIGVLEQAGLKVALCAPTGRAAKRMAEATGRAAKTVHRLLEYAAGEGGEGYFKRNEDNPIEADAVIVDEASMVDILLMQKLLKAIRPGSRLIFVGDADQLPSVGPGNVLKDVIASGMARIVRLKKIFRQAESSLIITNAHRVNEGMMPVLNRTDQDFFFERKRTAEEALDSTLKLVSFRLPQYGGWDALRDIQVLTPTRKGELGVVELNRRLQQAFNPPHPMKREHRYGDTVFRMGDKVMQIRNNYGMGWRKSCEGAADESGEGVFNGDMGFVTDVDTDARMLTVLFDDGRECAYEFAQAEELQLAYAVSIHKSQGSEFPVVVLPLVGGPPMLLTRNLLYTAITRAKKLVVITGREDCIANMVANNRIRLRYSGLPFAFGRLSDAEARKEGG
jgi:exodeoxyribonuclease V alpha subunit